MPPVAVGVAVAAGAYAAGIVIANAVMIGMIAMMVMVSLSQKKPSLDGYKSAQENKQVVRAAAAPKMVVLGETMAAGVLFFIEEQAGEQSENEWIHMGIAIAAHEIDGIGDIFINDRPLRDFGSKAVVVLHNNRATADPFMVANCPSWKPDMIGKNMAWLRVSLQFDAELYQGGLPNIKCVKRGVKVVDPRDGQLKFTSNSALMYLYVLRNVLKVPDSDIMLEQFKAEANICDELVTTPTGSSLRYTTNGQFELSESPLKILEAILDSCAGSRVYTGGKHGLLVGAYRGPATNIIHSRQICGDVKITPETAERERFNTKRGKYVSAKNGYSETDFPAVSVAAWVTQDGKVIEQDTDYRFVTNEFQAQRLAMLSLTRSRVGRTITMPLNLSGFHYRPGSNAKLQIEEIGIMNVEFRVTSWDFTSAGITVTAMQDSADMYPDEIGREVVLPPLTNFPSTGPAAPADLRYVVEAVGEVVQGSLVWSNTGTNVVDNVVTVLREGVVQNMINCPGERCRLQGLPCGVYEARVQAVALNGARSPMTTLSFTIALPAVPDSVDVIADNWTLQLIPRYRTALAFGTLCEFYYSTKTMPIADVPTKAFFLGLGATLSHSGLQPDTTYFYWIRTISAYGTSAFYDLSAKTKYDINSILDAMDGEIGAEHLRQELRTPIEAIPGVQAQVKTASETVNTLDQTIRASWYTKAQVNGVGGGFGLEVVLNADGSVMSSFVVDADVFAILSRAQGITSKRNPFIVKNGTVYMNHAMMDTAEIGTVIAKYIDVHSLNAATITASNISGSNISGTTISASTITGTNITGGTMNIADRFTVDGNGNVTIRNSPGGVGMALTNNRIDVKDDSGVVRVRIGQL